MINFTSVTVRNFQSYGDVPQTFYLNNQGTVLIVGENRDVGDSGTSANGVGKTTIENAVLVALFGKGIEPVKIDEFINIVNGKNLEIELVFDIGDTTYTIVRKRKPNALELYENDKNITLDTMANTQDHIIKLLGMDYDVFVLLYFLSPSKQSFMAMKGADQRDIMEKLLMLETLSVRAESLKKIGDELNTDLKISKRDLDHAISNKEKAEATLKRLKEKSEHFESGKAARVKELEETIDGLSDIDFDDLLKKADRVTEAQSEITNLERDLAKTEHDIERIELEINRIQKEIDEYTKTVTKQQEHSNQKQKEIDDYQATLDEIGDVSDLQEMVEQYEQYMTDSGKLHKIDSEKKDNYYKVGRANERIEQYDGEIAALEDGVCFNCGAAHVDEDAMEEAKSNRSKWIQKREDAKARIEELDRQREEFDIVDKSEVMEDHEYSDARDLIKTHDSAQANLKNASDALNNNPHDPELSSEDVEELEETIETNRGSIEEKKQATEKLGGEIDVLRDEIESINKDVDGLTRDELVTYQNQYQNATVELKTKKAEENPYTSEIEAVEIPDIGEHEDAVHEIEEDIRHIKFLRKLLMDNNSFVRKNIIDMYIPFLNKKIVEYSMQLDLPHIAQVNNDMTVSIEYMGKSVSFFNMSAGERLRLNVATTAAFKDLVASMGREPSMMMIDELFDGSLDESGMHKVFRFVSSICDDLFIISHRDEFKKEADKTLKVIKENGFSTVVNLD